MEFKDELNIQSDKRKIEKLVDDEVVTAEDIANAPIYIECPKCKHNNLDLDRCENCGEKYD